MQKLFGRKDKEEEALATEGAGMDMSIGREDIVIDDIIIDREEIESAKEDEANVGN